MPRRMIVATALIAVVTLGPLTPAHAQGERLKTSPPSKAAIKPLADGLFDFDEAGRRSGKPPADASARIGKLRSQAAQAKSEIRTFVSRLKANGEAEAFDEMVRTRAQSAAPAVVAELKAAGGATALLARADSLIDEMLADRAALGDRQPPSWASVLGFATVHAYGIRSGLCSAFWYVLSAGYGEAHAYRSCYY